MVRVIARIAVASALAAAVATPLTLSARADTPSLPGVPSLPGLPSLPVLGGGLPSLPGLGSLPSIPSLPGTGGLPVSVSSLLQNLGGLAPIPLALPGTTPSTGSPSGGSGGGGGTNAPTATAGADALAIPLLDTCVSCNSASAGDGKSSGNSNALEILGFPISGGSSKNPAGGDNNGDLAALPANPLLDAALADWDASSSSNGTTTKGHADSGLVDLALAPAQQVLDLAVLESGADAKWTPTSSSGKSFSNGVDLALGGGALVIIVLHSDADSSGGGSAHTYVASINGTELLSAEQVGKPIAITIPGIVTITLLQTSATGGNAGAALVTVTQLLGMPGTQASGVDATDTGGTGTGTAGCSGASCPGGGSTSTGTGTGVQAAGTSVPSTGIGVGVLGILLIGGGLMALAASKVARRWRALA